MGEPERVIYDDVGPNLTRRMLIMRVGQPVDAETWWAKLTAEAQVRASLFDFELGEKVKRHYLRIQWRPRELISIPLKDYRLQMPGWTPRVLVHEGKGVAAVAWWLDDGESISGGLRSAAETYWAEMQAWPSHGLIWRDPPSGELGLGDNKLIVLKTKWVPVGCVVVL